jgi:hypothetical protein
MAQLKSTNITGNLSVTGNVLASKIIKLGGTTHEVLLADGSIAKVSTTAQTVAPNAVTATAARTYIVQKNGDQLVVNVPWVKGESSGGTLTQVNLVGGGGITLSSNTIDSDSDSITISHADTSSQASMTTGGRTYINSITLDGHGHVTALGTNTETVTSYSLPLAANGTRGGIQIGYTSTENNRALLLDSEKAYVTLPSRLYAGRTDNTAPDAATNSGFYYSSSFPASVGFGSDQGTLFVSSYDNDWVAQIAIGCYTNKMIFRKKGGTWSDWETVATESWVEDLLGTGGDFDLDGYQPKDDDLTAIADLTGTSGFLKKTAANTWTLETLSIPAAQIQSDWNQTNTSALDYIKNKPTIPAAQIQSDWNQTSTTALDYIKNKPTIPTVPSNVVTGSSLTSDQVILGNGNSTIKASGKTLDKKGNRADGQIVCASGAGSIHSVYYVFTEGETARASWGYNATTDCVELAWR